MEAYVRSDPLYIQRGDDRPLAWPIKDADGDNINLSNWSAKAQARYRASSTHVLHEWSTDNNKLLLENGYLTLIMDGSDDWDWDVGVYDIKLTDPEGKTSVIVKGDIVLVAAVTQDG